MLATRIKTGMHASCIESRIKFTISSCKDQILKCNNYRVRVIQQFNQKKKKKTVIISHPKKKKKKYSSMAIY